MPDGTPFRYYAMRVPAPVWERVVKRANGEGRKLRWLLNRFCELYGDGRLDIEPARHVPPPPVDANARDETGVSA